jgi:hypothetical protein
MGKNSQEGRRRGGSKTTAMLTVEQLEAGASIDAKVRSLQRTGCDGIDLFVAMSDDMARFKWLIDTTEREDMDELSRRFAGFFHYAKILESIAAGIAASKQKPGC